MPPAAVLDTDTYNEEDDQFALAYLLLSPAQVDLQAVYAAPFHNERSNGPADGMEKSYAEIHRIIDLARPAARPTVLRGATAFLPAAAAPVRSAAVDDLIARARATADGQRLHVLAIAAITNVAAALLLAPDIADKITIVWLGGHAPHWPDTNEFNLAQDPRAARVIFNSAAPLVWIPCHPVASGLLTTVPELRAHLAPAGALGRYLTDLVSDGRDRPAVSKIIWDISVSAWLVNRAWTRAVTVPAPVLLDNLTWQQPTPAGRHPVSMVIQLDRDAVFADLFAKARG
ncbi:MAG: nucleoside hydrolase [Verrucomicrobiales bacterium]|jgi:inosine-uridine nucleoside N-ribohydrolase|nr:nucleoside hydrolase [Verrucomicrobiales bacterium]